MVGRLSTQGEKSDILFFVSLWLFLRIQLLSFVSFFFNDVSVFGDDKFCNHCICIGAKFAQLQFVLLV